MCADPTNRNSLSPHIAISLRGYFVAVVMVSFCSETVVGDSTVFGVPDRGFTESVVLTEVSLLKSVAEFEGVGFGVGFEVAAGAGVGFGAGDGAGVTICFTGAAFIISEPDVPKGFSWV